MQLQARLEDWLSLRLAVIHVYRDKVPASGANVRAAPGGNHYIWFLEWGAVTVTTRGQSVTARAGQWMMAVPGERHQQFTEDARIISVQLQAKWADGGDLFNEGLNLVVDDAEAPRLREEALGMLEVVGPHLLPMPDRIRFSPLTVGQYVEMQHLGLGFVVALMEVFAARGVMPTRVGQTDERLLAIVRALDRWPLDLPLEMAFLVKAGALSLDHLSRRFQETFGSSPKRYFENRRLDFARQMLAHSAMPAKEIASRLGFKALPDFSRWFKRHHGMPPTGYREWRLRNG